MQIDLGYHPDMLDLATYPAQNVFYGARLLAQNYNICERNPGRIPDVITGLALRSYNGGANSAWMGATADLGILNPSVFDPGTTGGNYVSNVLGLRNCFNF
jgi:soluble lytic murein transglycosylase-like protein